MGSLAPARRCEEFEGSGGEEERDFGLGVKGPERNIRGTNEFAYQKAVEEILSDKTSGFLTAV